MKKLFVKFFAAFAVVGVSGVGLALGLFESFGSVSGGVGAVVAVLVVSAALAKGFEMYFKNTFDAAVGVLNRVAQGDKTHPTDIKRSGELGDLVAAVNHLTTRDEAVKQANEDPLTGLANRRHLMTRLNDELEAGKSIALIFLDLDGFKPINDTYGHDVGDIALKQVSERLGACARENDIICRLGGDEFVVGYVGLDNRDTIRARAEKILELINNPYWIENTRVRMGASLGIAIAPEDAEEAEELLNAADESMYAAKQGGKNSYKFYS